MRGTRQFSYLDGPPTTPLLYYTLSYCSPTACDPMDLSRYHFTFDPRKKGLRKILGDLEADVMEAIWARGEATVHDVHERLAGADRELAYTTVMTVMSRLAEKGLLERRKDGAAYLYMPAASKEEFTGAPSARC
jgi:hypothetical protein